MMNSKKSLIASMTTGIVAGLCCFTPLLVWALAALGLSAALAYLDYVLLPMMGLSVAASLYFYWRYRKSC